ncbi:Uncharacterised protein [Clostridium sporogenes]|uniref:Uncharacterized protein n=1 Tax=Clostridium sporogenes TaxID=1509 RepID=A0A7U4JPX4_CLOSG|nr:hypothetical protein [Clostridium sporogenes]AKC63150.1 hypothetical protein CLSPO_c24300 [Clostridium sporogenes]AKJ90351.1 hypothetical protein CLSPOx_12175 [Clostridium sporogenes]KCZ67837.1 hypothetical protein CSPO_7c01800 [Clostridium sporogenes]OOO65498.1 hypothetical protein BS099_14525 [Clostridium sporogenes]SQC39981.1 Uncharacterised protein [Clostridium sporogenes]
MNEFHIIGVGIGIISGITFCILYFSFNKAWAVVSTTTGPFALFFVIYKVMKDSGSFVTSGNIISYTVGWIMTMSITIVILISIFIVYLKFKKDVPVNLNIINFLFGDESLKKSYQELTSLKAQKEINSKEYQEKINELNEQIEHYKRQASIYKQKEKSLNRAIEEGVYLELPYNNNIPLDKSFISEIPLNTYKLLQFNDIMARRTEVAIKNYIETKDTSIEMKEISLNYFIDDICKNVSECFFNPQDVRVHFRYLTSLNTYKKVAIFSEGKKCDDDLKILKCTEGMIKAAITYKSSLIKSINQDNHCIGTNDRKWKDYMVIIFDKFCYGSYPQLCMGIDVKNENIYRNIFYFLNLCNIDEIIQGFLVELDKKIEISKVIENKNIDEEIS